ncbi:MAG: hypothetical protein KGL53_01600, partial [Elusimicrobia bacterium]|nr:hypothetical protein [Elusimicrobiota bacterium]
ALRRPARVKANWLFLNSSHVIDLAFHLGGSPSLLSSFTAGRTPWHHSAGAFAGAGRTEGGALFSYRADWRAPGRWSVELCTRKRRLSLCPLETLSVQAGEGRPYEPFALKDSYDRAFKPGLLAMTKAFLSPRSAELLPTLAAHREFSRDVLRPLAGGKAPWSRSRRRPVRWK